MEMFAYDGGGNIWHNWQNRGNEGLIGPSYWAGWNEFGMSGHVATGGPAAVMDSTYRQIVFIPTSGDVFYTWEGNPAGAWSSWTDMGSSSSGLTGLVAINSGANGGLYVFGRNASGSIYYANKVNPNAAWSSFTVNSCGAALAGAAATAARANRMLVKMRRAGAIGAVIGTLHSLGSDDPTYGQSLLKQAL